jgi:hypothetical protein
VRSRPGQTAGLGLQVLRLDRAPPDAAAGRPVPFLAGRPGLRLREVRRERLRRVLDRGTTSAMSIATAIAAEPAIDAVWAEDRRASFAATFERDRHDFQASSPPPFRKLSGFPPTGAHEAGLSAGIKRTTPAP